METTLFEAIAGAIELVGVSAIVIGAIVASIPVGRSLLGREGLEAAFQVYRRGLGRAILLGLEFLVAADIIRTVAVSPTIESVLSLGIIVLVRTLLSFSLQVEIEGHLPWRRPLASSVGPRGPSTVEA